MPPETSNLWQESRRQSADRTYVRRTVWPVQDAKARFSEASIERGPQIVTRRGVEAAVLVPIAEWRRLQSSARRSLKQLLLAPEARFDRPPAKGAYRRRRAVQF